MLRIERIRNDIAALSRLAATAQTKQHAALQLARRWWDELPSAVDLQAHLDPLLREVPGAAPSWSGAVPATMAPPGKTIPSVLYDSRTDPPARLQNLALIGVDGSQIFPDRHALTLYYLIQVGAVIFRYDGRAPGVEVREWLHYKDEELFDAQDYLIGSEVLGQERMIQEMVVLADLAAIECRSGANTVFGPISTGDAVWVKSCGHTSTR
jgi:hypothetical protein